MLSLIWRVRRIVISRLQSLYLENFRSQPNSLFCPSFLAKCSCEIFNVSILTSSIESCKFARLHFRHRCYGKGFAIIGRDKKKLSLVTHATLTMADRARKKSRERKKSSSSDAKSAPVVDLVANPMAHIETFYEYAPPGMVKEEEEKPEDCIPDLPQNEEARKFLAQAPSKGLWMPLGKEVKVMQCWRCKAYGHRTGDRECPFFLSGNSALEKIRTAHEDPMHNYLKNTKRQEKLAKVERLKALLNEATSSDSDSPSQSEDERPTKKKKRRDSEKDRREDISKRKRHKKKEKKKERKSESTRRRKR
ncbi:retinitis pigmentosa 9 protein homolog isoform X1 [Oscarella lobularis]|uniref:retinitis pigmentosa 9 protein homolog isoform X1 n=1 Tax=Oscarella lobularis TaxID=121494 RepID=UPI0033135EE9